MARVAAAAALLAAGARMAIPLPPVPVTLQTLVLAVIGLTLGPWYGLSAVLLYLAMGLAGLPVFAGGGGIGYIYAPSFGFLLGFLPAVVVIGLLRGLDRKIPPFAARFLAALAGIFPVYALAVPYYSLIKGSYGQAPVWVILAPFLIYLPGDLAKALAAAAVAGRLGDLRPRSLERELP